jgi:hypothetical protein
MNVPATWATAWPTARLFWFITKAWLLAPKTMKYGYVRVSPSLADVDRIPESSMKTRRAGIGAILTSDHRRTHAYPCR